MIYVVIPVYNRLQATVDCLVSLQRQKNFKELFIIVVDDNSTDGTKKYLQKNFPNVTIINGTGSLFWGGSIFYGIEYVIKISKVGDWVLLVNNDVQLSSDVILELIKTSEAHNRKALVGALTVSAEDKKTIIKSGTVVKSWFLNITEHVFANQKLDDIINKSPVAVDFLTGRCLLHPVEIFLAAGNYDAKTFNHYGGDDEFSMRVKNYSFVTLLCPNSIVYLRAYNQEQKKKISIKKFFFIFFSIKSSSNIINKLKLSLRIVPLYARLSFFIIGVIKSFYIFLNR
jgi:GT2 family glycosyltransferase